MRDFTVTIYRNLLDAFLSAGYRFRTCSAFFLDASTDTILLRHDVDDRKLHSLAFARIQASLGIVGTYYFRMVPQSFDEHVIREIHELGHEVGYHYEDMDFAGGDTRRAIDLFGQHLEKLRRIVPVSSICMHGSPRSKYDNRDLWKQYNYRDFGLVGEPYFDIDFRDVFYLTDTGRRWDGRQVSVRDKVEDHFKLSFRSTGEIIDCIDRGHFPSTAMLNFHPQRWTDRYALWLREKYVQRMKNQVKYWVIKTR